MHGLGAVDLLSFARCSRALAHSADNPFAWLHTRANVTIKGSAIRVTNIKCIGRHAKIVMRVNPSRLIDTQQAILAALSAFPLPLYELHVVGKHNEDCTGVIIRWVDLPITTNLCVLDIPGGMTSELFNVDTLRYIAKLPRLHTLRVKMCAQNAAIWQPLPDFPSLTSLDIVDRHQYELDLGFKNSCLQHVRQCSKLTHLGIWSHALQDTGLEDFLRSSPQLRNQLRSLRLVNISWSPDLFFSYTSAFSSLANLSFLDIDGHGGQTEGSILSCLSAVPSLRALRVAQTDQYRSAKYVQAIASLLSSSPQLHFTYYDLFYDLESLKQYYATVPCLQPFVGKRLRKGKPSRVT